MKFLNVLLSASLAVALPGKFLFLVFLITKERETYKSDADGRKVINNVRDKRGVDEVSAADWGQKKRGVDEVSAADWGQKKRGVDEVSAADWGQKKRGVDEVSAADWGQ